MSARIDALIGTDPAFILVDPRGWKGADMKNIAKLGHRPRRDFLINFMHNFLARASGMDHEWLVEQMKDFFGPRGVEVLLAKKTEEELIALYRTELKRWAGLTFAADCVIEHPTQDRTWFRLVIGGQHKEIVNLFRDTERKVCGSDAAEARSSAHRNARQLELGSPTPTVAPRYHRLNVEGRAQARQLVLTGIAHQPTLAELWPHILEELHLTYVDLKSVIAEMHKERLLNAIPAPSRGTVKDEVSLHPIG